MRDWGWSIFPQPLFAFCSLLALTLLTESGRLNSRVWPAPGQDHMGVLKRAIRAHEACQGNRFFWSKATGSPGSQKPRNGTWGVVKINHCWSHKVSRIFKRGFPLFFKFVKSSILTFFVNCFPCKDFIETSAKSKQ